MARFKFRLEKVLDVREILEEQAKFKWATEENLAHKERMKLARLQEKARRTREFGYQHTDIEIRQAMYAYLGVLKEHINEQNEKVREQELIASRAKDAWFVARQETKKVATLREKQYEHFIQEELRKEQKVLDDMRSHVKI